RRIRHHLELGQRRIRSASRWRVLCDWRLSGACPLQALQREELSANELVAVLPHDVFLAHDVRPADQNSAAALVPREVRVDYTLVQYLGAFGARKTYPRCRPHRG